MDKFHIKHNKALEPILLDLTGSFKQFVWFTITIIKERRDQQSFNDLWNTEGALLKLNLINRIKEEYFDILRQISPEQEIIIILIHWRTILDSIWCKNSLFINFIKSNCEWSDFIIEVLWVFLDFQFGKLSISLWNFVYLTRITLIAFFQVKMFIQKQTYPQHSVWTFGCTFFFWNKGK